MPEQKEPSQNKLDLLRLDLLRKVFRDANERAAPSLAESAQSWAERYGDMRECWEKVPTEGADL